MTQHHFDPSDWGGDAEELTPHKTQLLDDERLCEATFMSKHEAFTAGVYLGSMVLGKTAVGDTTPD